MRTAYYFIIFLVALVFSCPALAQDFSNKGKDFWIGYGNHVRMFTPNQAAESMQLYITSDVNTSGRVEIASINFSQSFTITANQITTIDIPREAALQDDGLFDHGIHVTAAQPVVVYSFIYVNAVSGATLCLPTATLGRDYYSVNFIQRSNDPDSYSYFFVIATDPGTTRVEITPSTPTKGGKAAGVPFTVDLRQGQVYQVLGAATSQLTGEDLTGSHIRSVNTGSGCKRIAVFSGSGKIRIGFAQQNTSDNLYQQMYPTATWGKKFIAVPALVNTYNYFRIVKSDPSARVTLNGNPLLDASFVNNFYYQFGSSTPSVIESDKPILVAQYFTTNGNDGNPINTGDPEMIYLNPLEQTIDRVTLNSMQPSSGTAIQEHYLNVILKNDPRAIASFKIDGVPYTSFTPVPADPRYAYLRVPTTRGTHNVTCDTGFNIISYGFGRYESYGYSGGTNLKDLYQFISIRNKYATVDYPATCVNTPFSFAMTFPYQPTQMKWVFNGLFPDETVEAPVYDSTWVVNGKQLYQYRLNKTYTFPVTGTYPVRVVAQNPTVDGCTGEQEIDYDLQVINRPRANFSIGTTGCAKDNVQFADSSNTFGRQVIRWTWDLGDGTKAADARPAHLYADRGSFPVTYSFITDIGCLSDTLTNTVKLSADPAARFSVAAPHCIGQQLSFVDASTSELPLARWSWDFGDGSPVVTTSGGPAPRHAYQQAGTFTPTLQVQTETGCTSSLFGFPLPVKPLPVAAFSFGSACLPGGALQFTNTSTIPGGTLPVLNYTWDFGDGSQGTDRNPLHRYTSTGPFTVSLRVVSEGGCVDDSVQTVGTVYDQPVAKFAVNAPEACLGGALTFTDQSTSVKSPLRQWQWTEAEGSLSSQQHPQITFATAGTKRVQLVVVSEAGCPSAAASLPVTVNALPVAAFEIAGPACANRELLFTDRSAPLAGSLVKWSWAFGDGEVQGGNSPVRHTYTATGPYTATLQVETDKGCVSLPASKTFTVNPVPVAGFVLPASCIADPFSQFTDTSRISDGSEAAFTYLWNFGDKNASPQANTSTLKAPKHKYSVTDTFYVAQTVISNAGCRDTVTQKFVVNGSRPVSSFALSVPELCSNGELQLEDHSRVDFGYITRLEIVWDSSRIRPSVKSVVGDPGSGITYTHRFPELFRPESLTDSVYVIAWSGQSCFSSSWKPLTLKAIPQLAFAPIDPVCADGKAFELTQASLLNGLAGTGTYSGPGVKGGTATFQPFATRPGLDTLTYTFRADNGCTNSLQHTVRVGQAPMADAGNDAYVLEGGSIRLNGRGAGPGVTYQWWPTQFMDLAQAPAPRVSPTDDTRYRLTVTSSEGCTATDEVQVTVLKNLRIPNAFSPNGDGVHDRWEIPNLTSYPGATVEVYNRYGQLVFRSNGYGRPWDGTYNGNPVPVATYYYIIHPKNGRSQMSGFVDVIR
ncbi:PKD domain-containing protein [Paraflavisolibacter sp. H34]|uniref:PKD domain-containing protein n=1 Tax=Huijunlia imazamoxiresistens TaxID=3127457 RepID=UPI003018BC82